MWQKMNRKIAFANGDEKLIRESKLFDASWYLDHNPDVAAARIEPVRHFLMHGGFEGRAPSQFFDADWYLARYQDVANAGLNPLVHYIKWGENEGRSPTQYFDAPWYKSKYADAATSSVGLLEHFITEGKGDGRRIRAIVDPTPFGVSFGKEEAIEMSWAKGRNSVAVAIHLYYVDVLPEICEYLQNIPVHFTALFSVPSESHIKQAKNILKRYNLDCDCEFKIAQNRGRNFGPMLVDFRERILAHDLILHIHTKKSLRTGGEQTDWRGWLYKGLLGSEFAVRAILGRFEEDPKAGVIYPPIYPPHDHWYFHWHGSLHQGKELFSKIGVSDFDDRGLVEYPTGGMFWARTSALKKLFEYPWSYDEFEPEPSHHDGTLPHAIERSFNFIARDAGFNHFEMDFSRGLFRKNWSQKALQRYDGIKYSLEYIINNFETISFDFYDTLAYRLCATPDDVHNYIGWVLFRRKLVKDVQEFFLVRKKAEAIARVELDKGDVDIDDIYDHFKFCSKWSSSTTLVAKELEIGIENRILRLRPDIVNSMRRAHFLGKRVIVVSDTYMPASFFANVTNRLGIADAIDEIYCSASTGKRKDRADVWPWLFERENKNGLVHVGDNEETDTHIPVMLGMNVCPILHTTVLADLRGVRCSDDWKSKMTRWQDGVIAGPAIGRVGRKAFSDSGNFAPTIIESPFDLGYTVFGPIVFGFSTWLAHKSQELGLKKIAFLAREGHFLMKWFELIKNSLGEEGQKYPEAQYFPISRRLAIGALQSQGIDSDLIMGGSRFSGKLSDLLLSRIGFQADPNWDLGQQIVNTDNERDREKILKALEYLDRDIKHNAQAIAQRLGAYREQNGLNRQDIGMIDVGYSATIQLGIARLFPKDSTAGLYMVTSPQASRVREFNGSAFGFFSHEDSALDSAVKNYSLLLEALLTAPHGQVIDFRETVDGKMVPVYGEKGKSQHEFGSLDLIATGVERYINDLISTYGPDIGFAEFDPRACEVALRAATADRKLQIAPEVLRMLHVEDNFCGNGEIDAAAIYGLNS